MCLHKTRSTIPPTRRQQSIDARRWQNRQSCQMSAVQIDRNRLRHRGGDTRRRSKAQHQQVVGHTVRWQSNRCFCGCPSEGSPVRLTDLCSMESRCDAAITGADDHQMLRVPRGRLRKTNDVIATAITITASRIRLKRGGA